MSTNLNLGITPGASGRPARLRADAIQHAALIAIGRAFAEGDTRSTHLLDALEDLGRLAVADPRDGELDDALADVATLAHLDDAVMDLSRADVEQLADDAVHAVAVAAGSVVPLPTQQDRRAS